jgi:DedD protein
MDPALKQRLIGAAVLVALAVIFLPMLLGGPGPAPSRAGDVALDMPAAPARPLQTREIPLTLPSVAPPAPAVASAPADAGDRVVTVDADVAPRPDARPEDEPSAPAPAAPAPAVPAPVVSAPAAAPPAAASPAAVATPAPAASITGTRFVVNLGSYANVTNATSLRGRLVAAGMTVYSESINLDGKPVTRLRAGPFATRGEAEAARLQALKLQSDLPVSVLVLDTDDAAPTPARPAVAAGFAVQVGALRSEAEANTLRGRLRDAGFAAYVERANTDSGVVWRVRAGPELQRDRAERLRDDIRRKLQLDGLVVGHP